MIIKLRALWNLLLSDDFILLSEYGTFVHVRRGEAFLHLVEHFDHMIEDMENQLENEG